MNSNLKIVVVGCGGISNAWISTTVELADVTIVGLVDINAEAAKNRASQYQLHDAAIGTDLLAILDKTAPDIVFDCTSPATHAIVTQTALLHGCHVLGEKPLADSMESARKSVAVAAESGKVYAVMQNRRFDKRIRRFRRFLESGTIGDVTTLNSDFYIGAHFGGFRDSMSHVLLLDMAIHTFDAARFILKADPVTVWAKEWNPAGSWYDQDSSAVAFFEMSNGIVYTYRGSWCSEGLNTTWESSWHIIGTSGSAKWDGGDNIEAERVVKQEGFHSHLETIKVPAADDSDQDSGHSGLIKHFLNCVRTGTIPETIASDNIKSLAMVFGAIESAETGRVVSMV